MFCSIYNKKVLFSLQYKQQIGIRNDFLEGLVRLREPKHNISNMNSEMPFTAVAPPVFDGINYQVWLLEWKPILMLMIYGKQLN